MKGPAPPPTKVCSLSGLPVAGGPGVVSACPLKALCCWQRAQGREGQEAR